ncbi:hypothetical protein BKA82DRAFT_4202235 [Pisolithus tinctorius]|nr:hypothetical protein BKA82DRAFT_4202235 [Pisolithus tinctorius]
MAEKLVLQCADVVMSALAIWIRKFEEKPIIMIFLTIIFILDVRPILLFVGTSIPVISSILFVAAVRALAACVVAESIILWKMIYTLHSPVLVAAFATILLLSVYLLFRFILLVQSNGQSGVTEWVTEAKQCLLPRRERERPNGPDVAIKHPK